MATKTKPDLDALYAKIKKAKKQDLKSIYTDLTNYREHDANDLMFHHRLYEMHRRFYMIVLNVDPSPKYFTSEKYASNFLKRFRYDHFVQNNMIIELIFGSNRLNAQFIEFYFKAMCVFMQPSVEFSLKTNDAWYNSTRGFFNVKRVINDPDPGFKPSYRLVYSFNDYEFETLNYSWSRFMLRRRDFETVVYVRRLHVHHRLFFSEDLTHYWYFQDETKPYDRLVYEAFKELKNVTSLPEPEESGKSVFSNIIDTKTSLHNGEKYDCFAWHSNFSMRALFLHGKVEYDIDKLSLVDDYCTSAVFIHQQGEYYVWMKTLCKIVAFEDVAVIIMGTTADPEFYLLKVRGHEINFYELAVLYAKAGLTHDHLSNTYYIISGQNKVQTLHDTFFQRALYAGSTAPNNDGIVLYENGDVGMGPMYFKKVNDEEIEGGNIYEYNDVRFIGRTDGQWFAFNNEQANQLWIIPMHEHPTTDWKDLLRGTRVEYLIDQVKVS